MFHSKSIIPLVLMLLCTSLGADERPVDFGKQWVRHHPFTLMALTLRNQEVNQDYYAQAGLNSILIWKNKERLFEYAVRKNMPWHFHIYKNPEGLTKKVEAQLSRLVEQYPGSVGFQIFDEPKLTELAGAAEIASWIKQTYPEKLVVVNAYCKLTNSQAKLAGAAWVAGGMYDEPYVPYRYEDYLEDITRIVQPDVLMVCIYPFTKPADMDPAWYLTNKYFDTLSSIRKMGLQSNIPYW